MEQQAQGRKAPVQRLVDKVAGIFALGQATPTAVMAGVREVPKNEILIKDADTLEPIKKMNAIVLIRQD